MQVANAKTGMRVLLSKEDHKLLSNNLKQDHVWIEFNHKSTERFLALSTKEFPNSSSVKFYEARQAPNFPFFLMLTGKRWMGLKDLPFFSPEPVVVTDKNTHDGVLYYVHKPPMQRQPNAGKKMTAYKKGKEPEQQLNSGGLPKVEPKPEVKETPIEAKQMTLRQAVDVINAAKDDFGEEMRLEITNKGKLVMMMIYGSIE
jgi:hypothetical protein